MWKRIASWFRKAEPVNMRVLRHSIQQKLKVDPERGRSGSVRVHEFDWNAGPQKVAEFEPTWPHRPGMIPVETEQVEGNYVFDHDDAEQQA